MITAIIIDNEPKSIFTLNSFLYLHCPAVEVQGSANNAKAGSELIARVQPQLVFLDIEMPIGSGFDLLRSLQVIDFEIIFITAYNQYAINAFRFSAADYLLKPLSIPLLKEAVNKVAMRLQEKSLLKNYELLLRNMDEQNAGKQKMALTDNGVQYLVPLDEVMYLTGSSNYTHIHTKNKAFLSTKRLKEFEEIMPGEIFCRIHNSHIINMQYVLKVQKGRGGSVIMQDGKVFEIAFRRKEGFLSRFIK